MTAGSGGGLALHRLPSAQMAQRTVELVRDRLAAGAQPHHLAVLARVNSALLPVQVALTDAGVGHTAPLDAAVLGRTGVRAALAYLRLGLDLERIRLDDVLETINRPARKVRSAVQPLLGRHRTFSMAHLEQVADSLGETHRDRFLDYLGDLRDLEAAITDQADTAVCLSIIRNRIGLGDAMDALDASRTRPEGSSHGDDLDALEQVAALQPDPAAFRDWLVDRLRVPRDAGGVTLSSVHRVKGMEWPYVVVFAANQGLFPHRLSDDVEEERRVFHVAVTRCQEGVDVVADRARTSAFLAELHPPVRLVDDAERATAPSVASTAPTGARAASTAASAGAADGARGPSARGDGTPSESAPRGVAVVGRELQVAGGFAGTIAAVERDHAVVAVTGASAGGSITLRVPYGQPVRMDGDDVPLTRAAPRPSGAARAAGYRDARSRDAAAPSGGSLLGDPDEPPVDEDLFQALRSWRARIAAETGVPAYLVFHDRHLRGIAARKPSTLGELARCPGLGDKKLERYGDDVLDVVASHPA